LGCVDRISVNHFVITTMVAGLMLSLYRTNSFSLVTRVLQHASPKRGKCPCLQQPSYGALRRFSSTPSASRASNGGSSSSSSLDSIDSIWIPILGGFLVATAGGMKYIHDHVGGTEGMQRSISFYSLAIPKYLEYRWHMWRKSPDHVWEQLDHDTSRVGLLKLKELRGFYIKCGQICAANIGNAFPPIWIETMAELQDKVPHEDYRTIQRIINSELDMKSVFATFEKEPIGSAAIGQVHRATLKDGTPYVF
jgi:ABC1 atypical kinase-like domain